MRSLKKVEWDTDMEINKDVSPSMESLTKDTVTMHKVINKYLNEMQVRMIMGPVFESYREQVSRVIVDAVVKTPGGKARYVYFRPLPETRLTNTCIDSYERQSSSMPSSVPLTAQGTWAVTSLAWLSANKSHNQHKQSRLLNLSRTESKRKSINQRRGPKRARHEQTST
jgi:hypothetical protein